jgi:hypothetical protein
LFRPATESWRDCRPIELCVMIVDQDGLAVMGQNIALGHGFAQPVNECIQYGRVMRCRLANTNPLNLVKTNDGIFLRNTLNSWPRTRGLRTLLAKLVRKFMLIYSASSAARSPSRIITSSQLSNEGNVGTKAQGRRRSVLMKAVATAVGSFRDISPTAAFDARPLRRPGRRHLADNEPCRRRSPRHQDRSKTGTALARSILFWPPSRTASTIAS